MKLAIILDEHPIEPLIKIIYIYIYIYLNNGSPSRVEPAVIAAKAQHDPHCPWFLTPVIFDEKFPVLRSKIEILKTEKAYAFSHHSFIFLDNLAS